MSSITDKAKEIDENIKAVGKLFDSETSWTIKRLLDYQRGLFTFAKFKTGDRVEIAVTPDINNKESWGWMGSKHFLIEGARGTVKSCDYDDGFSYSIMFDDESWVHDGVVHPTPDSDKHLYHFKESSLRPPSPKVCITCGCKK